MNINQINSIVISEDVVNHALFLKKGDDLHLKKLSWYNYKNDNIDEIEQIVKEISHNSDNKLYANICFISSQVLKNMHIIKKGTKEIKSQIINEIKSIFEINLTDYYIDYEVYENNEFYTAFSASIPKEVIDPFLKAFAKYKFKLIALETDANSVKRICPKSLTGKYYLHIHIRENASMFMILKDKQLFVERDINVGLKEIVRTIAINGGVAYEEANQILLKKGLIKNQDIEDDNEYTAISDAVDKLSIQIQRTIDYFTTTYRLGSIESIFITGLMANVPDIDKYFMKLFSVETILGTLYGNLVLPEDRRKDIENVKYIGTLVSLGMREL